MTTRKKGGLGRGLDALFENAAPIFEEEEKDPGRHPVTGGGEPPKAEDGGDENRIIYIDINDIRPNSVQPRKTFEEDKLRDLAASIKANGVIQPLIVRHFKRGYELVAGERRWRAARIAELKKVPCIIRDFDDRQNMIVAIIENMQREDLDPIDEAGGLRELIGMYGFTQSEASETIGKSRAYIANSLRLLKLPEDIQDSIRKGKLSAAHGRTIAGLSDKASQERLCAKIVNEGLSVRATERMAEKLKAGRSEIKKRRKKASSRNRSVAIMTAEDELCTILGTKVRINGTEGAGRLEIEYYSTEELNRLIEILGKTEDM